MSRGTAFAGLGVLAAGLLVGCTPSETRLNQPGESDRTALEAKLTSQLGVAGLPTAVVVLQVVVSREGPNADLRVTLVPNPGATLPRLGRVTTTTATLARPGVYFGVTNMNNDFVFLLRVAAEHSLIGEGPTPDLNDDPRLLEGTTTVERGLVVSSRIPLTLGGKFSVFTTAVNPVSGVRTVDELLLVIPFGPGSFPALGRRHRIIP